MWHSPESYIWPKGKKKSEAKIFETKRAATSCLFTNTFTRFTTIWDNYLGLIVPLSSFQLMESIVPECLEMELFTSTTIYL